MIEAECSMTDEKSEVVYSCPAYGKTDAELLQICRSIYFYSKEFISKRIKYFQIINKRDISTLPDDYIEECVDGLIVVNDGKYRISIPETLASNVEIFIGNKKCTLEIAK
jgi:hypothetical protein